MNIANYDDAEKYIKKGLEIRKAALGNEHPYTANSYVYLGNLYSSIGRLNESEEFYKRALVIIKKKQGENHVDAATTWQDRLWLVLQTQAC